MKRNAMDRPSTARILCARAQAENSLRRVKRRHALQQTWHRAAGALSVVLCQLLLCASGNAAAHGDQPLPPPSPELQATTSRKIAAKSFHPAVILRDSSGQNVLQSGALVSFGRTCGSCHDTQWIGEHGYHFRLGLDEQTPYGQAPSGRAWDFGPGLFGRWDPLAAYDAVLLDRERTTSLIDNWVSQNRQRLVGGGVTSFGNQAQAFETNCALCHVRGASPVTQVTVPFEAYSTASLESLGIVTVGSESDDVAQADWNRAAFLPDGSVDPLRFRIQAPTSEACGHCHGYAQSRQPELRDWNVTARQTETTGQLFVGGRISDSTLNVAHRSSLGRPWDVHAERLLNCSDCHFAPNDPGSAQRTGTAQPQHLMHEVRTVALGEFLRKPSHEFAKGYSSQGTVANALDGTMRRCEGCHDAPMVHRFLPKAERHLAQVACETCHIERVHAPARRVTDYSVVDERGEPRLEYRGVQGDSLEDPAAYLSGYQPLLLRRVGPDGTRLFPYNVVTSFFWVVEDPKGLRPASIELLKLALYERPGAAAQLKQLLDRNHDGAVAPEERVLSSATDVEAVRALLVAAGAKNPRLVGEMQPFGIHHGVAPARLALRDCAYCHSREASLAANFQLAAKSPYGVIPTLVADSNVVASFQIEARRSGELLLVPNLAASGLHVFGLSRTRWLDWAGLGAVISVFLIALGHGGLRLWSRRKREESL